MTTDTTETFSLSPDREAAFWRAVQSLGVDPGESALTLIRQVLTLRDRADYAEGFGAAAELRYHLDRGRPVQFHQRPSAERPPLPLFGPDDPLRAGYDGPIAEVMPDAC